MITTSRIVIIICLLVILVCIRAYIDSIQVINWYYRRQLPLTGRPPKPTWSQRLLSYIPFLPPVNW